MSWLLWIVVAWLAFSAITSILMVGKERQPTTPGVAAVGTLIVASLIVLTIVGGGLL